MSIQAYQRASAQAENPRETEFRLFALVTAGLIKAKEVGRDEMVALADALHKNRRLWSLLAQDCASEDNSLPKPVRAQIISLSMWVSRHSSAVLQSGEDIDPLIEVNRTVMQGLGLAGANAAHASSAA
jgi:flagellar biosynthesis activator protein FlaF